MAAGINQADQQADQASSTSWRGYGELSFSHDSGTTRLSYCHTQAPFKVQRPFYPEGPDLCHSVVLHTAGGMVSGDRLDLKLHLQPQAKALVTTAAASKVYRRGRSLAQPQTGPTRQTIQIQMAANSYLEWLPQETILFQGADYRQQLRVDLAPGAIWCGWEITRLGRTARGEQFLTGEWRSQTEVWQQERPLWIDPQWLGGNPVLIHSPHGLAGQPVVASLVWIGQPVAPELIEQARNLCQGQLQNEGQMGVTQLPSGLLCRYRGPSSWAARAGFIAVWELLRRSLLDRPLCLPRVWPT